MIKVALIGAGTVSKHFMQVFATINKIALLQVLPSRGNELTKALQALIQKEEPDIYIIAVSDDAIKTVSQQLVKSKKLIVHTSGSVAMQVLPKASRRGVFYPLQTFSKGRKVDFKTIPICLEAEDEEDLALLNKLAHSISERVYEISSQQRKSLHLAAVFVNNFTNHMYQIGKDICEEHTVPFDILQPLISETAAKINSLSPFDAQTGPAKRNDYETIENHLNQLKSIAHKDVYQILTKSIQETHQSKLEN